MADDFSIKNKIFLITGAASGLGAGFADKFLQEGAKHIAILDVAEEIGEATANRLKSEYGDDKVSFTRCDVTDEATLARAFRDLVDKHKTIDVVINNAGILNDHPDVYKKANGVNWEALTTLSVMAWRHQRADKGGAGGTIVNVSSVAALAQWPFLPIYSGAKAAVLHFSSCLGMEPNYTRSKVRVLCMSYGPTQTPLMHNLRNKCMDDDMGQGFHDADEGVPHQSVNGAVEAMETMLKRGKSGSSWLAMHGKPAKDISKYIEAAYAEIYKALLD